MFGFGRTVDRTDEIMSRHLDGDFRCFAAQKDAPTAKQLAEVARQYGCKLPSEFIAHSTGALGGAYIEVKEDAWPRPEPFAVGPLWTFLYGMFVFGLAPEIPEWMDISLAAAEFKATTGRSLLPCLKILGDADIYLFDATGAIVQWRHETDELEPVGLGFFGLFERELRDLRERKDRKVAGT